MKNKIIFKIKILNSFLIFSFVIEIIKRPKKKKVGVISIRHEVNIGNNLLKYAMYIKLSEMGFDAYIIGTHWMNSNISFIKQKTNLKIIKYNFKEIKKREFDILMVNSDQTWRNFDNYFYDYAFLKFAYKWKIKKFIYGASLGYDYWTLTKQDEKIAKILLKNFNGISVREKGSIKLIEQHLGIKPLLVLDPTLLIDKKYYLDLINNYKSNISVKNEYIFTYSFVYIKKMSNFLEKARKALNFKVYDYYLNNQSKIEDFIYGIMNCKAVVTSSYHGTIFAIIFNKPFISFLYKNSPKERILSLGKLLGFENRIFEYNQSPSIHFLTTPLKINYFLLNSLKNKSINFLKQNLGA